MAASLPSVACSGIIRYMKISLSSSGIKVVKNVLVATDPVKIFTARKSRRNAQNT